MEKATIVIPVYNEGENIVNTLNLIQQNVKNNCNIIIVYDSEEDTTLAALNGGALKNFKLPLRLLRNKYGKGALNAIKSGMEEANSEYVVVTMADLSDPPSVIDEMIKKADETDADIVCGSRYMTGGSQTGGPKLKGLMSKFAGLSLHYLAGLPTCDPTNSFKLYRKSFLQSTPIESTGGFELGIELVVKAWKNGYKVEEVPTSWQDRAEGKSNFQLKKWLPKYLYWYFNALSSNPPVEKSCNKFNRILKMLSWSVLIVAAFWNFWHISKFAINVPWWDEWDYLPVLENFNWSNLVGVHVQHRIIFTRILFYLDYLWENLNFTHLIIFNYLLYLGFVGATMLLFKKYLKEIACFPLFFLPFFSDLTSENLVWAGQSQFHFTLMFCMLAIYCGFVAKRTIKSAVLFGIFMLLSIFSMSPMPAVCVLIAWCMREAYLFWRNPENRNRQQLIIIGSEIACVTIASIVFFTNYNPEPIGSFNGFLHFVGYLVISYGRLFCLFPADKDLLVWVLPLGLLFVIPAFLIVFTILSSREKILENNGSAFAIIMWGVVFAGAVTLVRTGFLADRHMEAILPIVPAIASICAMTANKRLRKLSLYSYLIFILLALGFSWSFKDAKVRYEERKIGKQMLIEWHEGNLGSRDTLDNQYLYPRDFAEQAKMAERLNLSYLKDVKIIDKNKEK